jgi:hypothetical protein
VPYSSIWTSSVSRSGSYKTVSQPSQDFSAGTDLGGHNEATAEDADAEEEEDDDDDDEDEEEDKDEPDIPAASSNVGPAIAVTLVSPRRMSPL